MRTVLAQWFALYAPTNKMEPVGYTYSEIEIQQQRKRRNAQHQK
jgi:hypothetical protein